MSPSPTHLARPCTPKPSPGGAARGSSAALFLTILVACGEGGDGSALVTTRTDSAGVEIVTVASSPDAAPILADLTSAEVLRLGSPAGAPEEQFGHLVDVVALPDGGVAALDGQAAVVRVFGSDGGYRSSFGQRGDGPGELRDPVALAWLAGDTLAVFDPGPTRVTRYAMDGGAPRVATLADIGRRIPDGRFTDEGRLIGQSHLSSSGGEPTPNGEPVAIRNTVVLRLFDQTGAMVRAIDTVPSLEEVVSIRMGSGALSVLKRPTAFARDNHFAPGPAGTWSSENDRFELRLRDTDSGRLLRVVRVPSFDVPLAAAITEDMGRRVAENSASEDERRLEERWLELSPRPDLQPAFDALVSDDRGRVWARRWTPFGEGRRWWVFEPDGDLLGTLAMPVRIRITSVTCDAIAGIERDDLGVTYAVRYTLDASWLCAGPDGARPGEALSSPASASSS